MSNGLAFGSFMKGATPFATQALMQKQQMARQEEQATTVFALDLATKAADAGNFEGSQEIIDRANINKKYKQSLKGIMGAYVDSLSKLTEQVRASTSKATSSMIKAAGAGDQKAYNEAVMAAIADPNVSTKTVTGITKVLDPIVDPSKRKKLEAEAEKAGVEAEYAEPKAKADIIKSVAGGEAAGELAKQRKQQRTQKGIEFDTEQIQSRFFGATTTQPGKQIQGLYFGMAPVSDIPEENREAYETFMRLYHRNAREKGPGEKTIQATVEEFTSIKEYRDLASPSVMSRMGGRRLAPDETLTDFLKGPSKFVPSSLFDKEMGDVMKRLDKVKARVNKQKSRRK